MTQMTMMFSNCHHSHWVGRTLWQCVNAECDGTHHYLVVAK